MFFLEVRFLKFEIYIRITTRKAALFVSSFNKKYKNKLLFLRLFDLKRTVHTAGSARDDVGHPPEVRLRRRSHSQQRISISVVSLLVKVWRCDVYISFVYLCVVFVVSYISLIVNIPVNIFVCTYNILRLSTLLPKYFILVENLFKTSVSAYNFRLKTLIEK